MVKRYKFLWLLRVLVWVLILVGSAALSVSAVKYNSPDVDGRVPSGGYMDAGELWLRVWNIMAVDEGEWPGGSSDGYIYSGNYWFGMGFGDIVYVVQTWQMTEVEWHPLPPCENRVLMSNDPYWALLPYVEAGIDPDPVSDLDCFTWCDDSDAGETGPLGLRTYMRGFQWGVPGHDDWVVLEYKLWDLSPLDLEEYFLANPYDNDVGGGLDYIDDLVLFEGNDFTDEWTNPTEPGQPWTVKVPDGVPDENDAVNFDADGASTFGCPRMMPVMYDSGGEARDFPGYVGLRFMFVEFDPDDETTYNFRVTSQHSWDIMNDPETDEEKFGYMSDVGTYEERTTPYDWRVCPAMGPLSLARNETQLWWCAIVMGSDLNDMRMNADQVYADFLGPDGIAGTGDDWFVPSPPRPPRLVGIKGDGQVTLRWNPAYETGKDLETELDPRTGIADFDGYIVWRSDIGFDIGWEPILWIDKKSTHDRAYYPWGWRVSGGEETESERVPDGYDPNNPDNHPTTEPDLTVVSPDRMITYESITGGSSPVRRTTGQFYEYVDEGVVNGMRYYYAVVAYDFGEEDQDVGFINSEPAMGGRNANAFDIIPTTPVAVDLANVKVVPNPYRGSADWDEWTPTDIRLGRIYFTNLPGKCTIRIYTIAGDLVKTITRNNDEYGDEPWDLTGGSGVQVASGIYVYHVEVPNSDETKIGKFAVLIGKNW
jgi:hypothetical protein